MNYSLAAMTYKDGDIWGFVSLIILFLIVIIAAYYVTILYVRYQKKGGKQNNLEIVEAIQLGQGKNLFLVRAGNKFLVISSTKNQVSYITELRPEDIVFTKQEPKMGFKSILSKIKTDSSDDGKELHESNQESSEK